MSSFTVKPLDATFGAVVTEIKLAELDDKDFDALYQTWLDYALLIFPGQHLTDEEQQAFARRFGELEFNLAPISNVRKDGSIRGKNADDDVVRTLKGNMGWHMDSTYMPVQAKGAVFTARVVPSEGGETGWADMRAAYDALSEAMKEKIDGLVARHSLRHSQAKANLLIKNDGSELKGYGLDQTDSPLRKLVKIHPETGRPVLVAGRHAYSVVGLPDDESEALLNELMDFACRPPRIYHHKWQPGDAVVWDNRSLCHQACPWNMDEPRIMMHARIAGDPVTEAGEKELERAS